VFIAWEDAVHAPKPECLTCLDADLLLLSGEHFDQVAARLGIARASLITHLHRHGRSDLAPRRQHA
jgi:hypothetical protein